MANIKIAVIGAGGCFVVGLIHDICVTPSLHQSTISFMDINPERLDNSYELCKRYCAEFGVNLKIEKTLDRRAALAGADFVVTIALVDGPRRLSEGWRIARELGYKWPGSYHILYDEPFWLNFYQLRLFEDITRDMLELCPQAWHLLVSNPVLAATTWLQRKYPRCRMVGLCHGFAAAYAIPKGLGLPEGKFDFEIAGVNHFVWLTRATHEGRDIFPLLQQWLTREARAYWDRKEPRAWYSCSDPLCPKAMDLFRQLGVIPIGDTANWTGASWPWWYHSDPEVEKFWQTESEAPWFEYVKYIKNTPRRYQEMVADKSRKIADEFKLGSNPSGEPMIPIMEAITQDRSRVIIVNMLNREEYVEGIPRDFEVEIPAMVSRRGIQGLKTTPLPRPMLAHILRDRVAPVEMELSAYEQGRRALLRQLILMDKWTRDLQHADDLIDAIFALPYHAELREHYQ